MRSTKSVERAARTFSKVLPGGVAEIPGACSAATGPTRNGAVRVSRRHRAAVDCGAHGDGVPTGEFILGYENHYGLIPPTPVVPSELDPARLLPPLANPYHAGEHLAGPRPKRHLHRLSEAPAGCRRLLAISRARSRSSRRGSIRDAGWRPSASGAGRRVRRWRWRRTHDDPSLAERDDFLLRRRSRRPRVPAGRARAPHQPAGRAQAVRAAAVAEHDRSASAAPPRARLRSAAVRSARAPRPAT